MIAASESKWNRKRKKKLEAYIVGTSLSNCFETYAHTEARKDKEIEERRACQDI